MRELGYEEVLHTITIDRAATCRLFDLAPDVLAALEQAGVVEYDSAGLAEVATLVRGVWTEACMIAFTGSAQSETARAVALAASQQILAMIEFLKDRVPIEVLNGMVEQFAELKQVFEAAAPILTMPIGTQPPAEAA